MAEEERGETCNGAKICAKPLCVRLFETLRGLSCISIVGEFLLYYL